MEFLTKEYSFPSASGLCDIYAQSAAPIDFGSVKGVVQISHGMAEHSSRYASFAMELCRQGYAVFISDHVGHGKSVSSDDMLGYFGEKDGYKNFIEDAKQLTDIAKAEYKALPFIFFGHSMGSFVARSYTEKYGKDIDGAVYCGTSGANPGASAGVFLADLIIKKYGAMHRSKAIDSIAFGSYNKKTEKRTEYDWLTKDEKIVDKYIADKYCGFLFTAAGYKDMFKLLKSVSGKSWYKSVPTDLPILLMSGADDPVGEYGKGVKQVLRDLKETKHKNVTLKLFPNDRHEIHNEIDKDKVINELIEWLDGVVESVKPAVTGDFVELAAEEIKTILDETVEKSKVAFDEAVDAAAIKVEEIVVAAEAEIVGDNIIKGTFTDEMNTSQENDSASEFVTESMADVANIFDDNGKEKEDNKD